MMAVSGKECDHFVCEECLWLETRAGHDVTDGDKDDTKIVLEIVLVPANMQHQDLGQYLIILRGLR